VEEHGGGCQFVRVRTWPRLFRRTSAVILALAGLAAWAASDGAVGAAAALGAFAATLAVTLVTECAHAAAVFHDGLSDPAVLEQEEEASTSDGDDDVPAPQPPGDRQWADNPGS
jgi:hypothetical protein